MAKKSIASQNKVLLGGQDVVAGGDDEVKFICDFQGHTVFFKKTDESGKVVTKCDANGNNVVPVVDSIHFTPIPYTRGPDGKISSSNPSCFLVVSREKFGKDYDEIMRVLNAECKNPKYKMYTEDDHFKNRNPEAFRIASEKKVLEDRIAELERKRNN